MKVETAGKKEAHVLASTHIDMIRTKEVELLLGSEHAVRRRYPKYNAKKISKHGFLPPELDKSDHLKIAKCK